MAAIAKVAGLEITVVDALVPQNAKIGSGMLAGEAIATGDLVYIKSDGLVWRCNGAAANAAAKCAGIVAQKANAGDPVTIFRNVNVRYATALTPGAQYYVSATVGALDTAATVGGTAPIGFAVDAQIVFIHGSDY